MIRTALNPKLCFSAVGIFSMLVVMALYKVSVVPPANWATKGKFIEAEIWSEGAIDEIYYWLECPDHQAREAFLKAPDASVWRSLHEMYKSILPSSPSLPSFDQEQTSAYPVEVKETTYNGEQDIGVFATRDIPKGMLVWKSTHTARFDTGKSFRAFVRALPVPQACDVLDWAYPRYLGSKPVVCVDLYFGSLLGICDVETECNLQISRGNYDTALGCGAEFYASRDIAAGELLLMDHFSQDAEALVPLGLAHE
jgi:hypothetical protein